MMSEPELADVTRFRALVLDLLGLQFDDAKYNALAKVLHNRALALDMDYAPYLDRLANLRPFDEFASLARELTVTETYFLRNFDQFKAFIEVTLANRSATHSPGQRVDVLSAGCASGEEAYSLAIAVQEYLPSLAKDVTITAVDLNPSMLQRAARARYSNWSLRECPAELKKRWFKPDGDQYVLQDAIRRAVHFEARNLNEESAEFWRPNRFDVVFCRNVLMYFSSLQMQSAIARIARSLKHDGYLFLGHAETLRGISNDFHLCHTHGTFYYQRKEELTHAIPLPAESLNWQPVTQESDTSWIAAIQQASERIHALMPAGDGDGEAAIIAAQPPKAHAATRPANLDHALEALRSEQYAQSLQHLHDLAGEHAADPDVLLLKAISLSQSGALTDAETVCRELLQHDEMHAGAYYVLALCREGAGDTNGAVEHDQTAAYLDPEFAMPRFHLGLLQRRRGDRLAARRDLSEALTLLQKEDASRVLLFGGGFKRETLIGLCRAELLALGDAR